MKILDLINYRRLQEGIKALFLKELKPFSFPSGTKDLYAPLILSQALPRNFTIDKISDFQVL